MLRFFLHLHDPTDRATNIEGIDVADMDALRRALLAAARDIMIEGLRRGVLDLRYCIDAQDAAGEVVLSLPFRRAVEVIGAE